MAKSRAAQGTIFTGSGELVATGAALGGSALTTAIRPLEVRHPLLAFIERRSGQGSPDAAGISRPPVDGPATAGPTAGQWGSG